MYSILVVLKNDDDFDWLIGSSWSLSIIYEPAQALNLSTISNFHEDDELINLADIESFKNEIQAIINFWNDAEQDNHIKKPSENRMRDLDMFYSQLKNVEITNIKRITLF